MVLHLNLGAALDEEGPIKSYIPFDLDVYVEAEHTPYEPPERGPFAQYPGMAESVSLESVRVALKNQEALARAILEHPGTLEYIEQEIRRQHAEHQYRSEVCEDV